MKCGETVKTDDSGYYFRNCGNLAKWRVNNKLRCGIHARLDNWYVKQYGRVPIKEGAGT